MTTDRHLSTIDPVAFTERCRQAQRRGALATVIASTVPDVPVGARLAVHPGGYVESEIAENTTRQRIAQDARGAIATGMSALRRYGVRGEQLEVQVDAVVPAPRMFVFGGGELAALVVEAARKTGWEPFVCSHFTSHADHAALIAGSDRAAAIVLATGDALDSMVIASLLATRVRYVGVAGHRARIEALIGHLRATTSDLRLHAPLHANLDVEPPRVIANALVADALAELTGTLSLRPSQRKLVAAAMPGATSAAPAEPTSVSA
jgi:xanthine dehydrogenase accessory factor